MHQIDRPSRQEQSKFPFPTHRPILIVVDSVVIFLQSLLSIASLFTLSVLDYCFTAPNFPCDSRRLISDSFGFSIRAISTCGHAPLSLPSLCSLQRFRLNPTGDISFNIDSEFGSISNLEAIIQQYSSSRQLPSSTIKPLRQSTPRESQLECLHPPQLATSPWHQDLEVRKPFLFMLLLRTY